MTHEDRVRRIGWIAFLALAAMLYLGLHLKVHAVKSDLVRAEHQIVQLEEQKLLLETEFLTRSNQLQLARWNRVDFGLRPPEAGQFISGERQLAMLGSSPPMLRPGENGGEIRFAGYAPEAPEENGEVEVASAEQENKQETPRLAVMMGRGATRVPVGALAQATLP